QSSHRRRAYGRTRSGGARAFSRSLARAGGRARGLAFDTHRVGRGSGGGLDRHRLSRALARARGTRGGDRAGTARPFPSPPAPAARQGLFLLSSRSRPPRRGGGGGRGGRMPAFSQIARAVFPERSRRYSFLVTLVATLFIAYNVHTGNIQARLGSYRGILNSAWIGGVMTLTITVLLSLVGFYLVKNAVERDRLTRVGEILATTPMSRAFYCLGKTFSTFFVLGTLVAVLAVSSVVLQLVARESTQIDLVALLLPLVLVALPAMLLVSALAVFFECTPVLHGGVGNVLYFFLWSLPLVLALQVKGSPDVYGARTMSQSMQEAAHGLFSNYDNSFSFTIGGGMSGPIRDTFVWNGVRWTPELIASRLEVVAMALAVALLAALFFDRFDPSKSSAHRGRVADPADVPQASATKVVTLAPAHAIVAKMHRAEPGFRFGTLVVAEFRLMLRGAKRWWLVVAAALAVAQLFVPLKVGQQILLPIAWLWPVLLWSSLGSRERRNSTEGLVFASPRLLARQWPAAWVA